ncbi:hypothetical protein RPHASCH2410_CH17025 [Rhizobium phaseoli Ch24-10]|nr:hypothetical protein RPHASCH2410_CH17025 [Rhizobium phaseoli Ch24-10]
MTPAASAARHASCIQWKPCRWTLSRGMSLAHRKSAPTWRIMLCENRMTIFGAGASGSSISLR